MFLDMFGFDWLKPECDSIEVAVYNVLMCPSNPSGFGGIELFVEEGAGNKCSVVRSIVSEFEKYGEPPIIRHPEPRAPSKVETRELAFWALMREPRRAQTSITCARKIPRGTYVSGRIRGKNFCIRLSPAFVSAMESAEYRFIRAWDKNNGWAEKVVDPQRRACHTHLTTTNHGARND